MLSHAVNGRAIGFGRGHSIDLAKKEAAIRALRTLHSDLSFGTVAQGQTLPDSGASRTSSI